MPLVKNVAGAAGNYIATGIRKILRFKVYEAILVAGEDSFSAMDIRVRVKGGGHVSQVYAIRQAIAKAVVAYYAKFYDAASAFELKKKLIDYDRTLLIADPHRMEPKKFGGQGARARRQKRCVLRFFEALSSTDCIFSQLSLGCSTSIVSRFFSCMAAFCTTSCSIFMQENMHFYKARHDSFSKCGYQYAGIKSLVS